LDLRHCLDVAADADVLVSVVVVVVDSLHDEQVLLLLHLRGVKNEKRR
jgi:hypothetical protein